MPAVLRVAFALTADTLHSRFIYIFFSMGRLRKLGCGFINSDIVLPCGATRMAGCRGDNDGWLQTRELGRRSQTTIAQLRDLAQVTHVTRRPRHAIVHITWCPRTYRPKAGVQYSGMHTWTEDHITLTFLGSVNCQSFGFLMSMNQSHGSIAMLVTLHQCWHAAW
jgi:hypothetical protein